MHKAHCELCGKEFESQRKKRFCSIDCRNKNNASLQVKRGEYRVCPVCGKEFYVTPKDHQRRMAKWCSTQCRGVGMSGENNCNWNPSAKHHCRKKTVYSKDLSKKVIRIPRITKQSQPKQIRNCPVCGKDITNKPSVQKTCSSKCAHAVRYSEKRSTKVERTCTICGKKFYVVPAVARYGQGVFCSRSCFSEGCRSRVGSLNPKWRGGGKKYYGGNWHKQRDAARNRDNNTCCRCGISSDELGRKMDVHHVRRMKSFAVKNDANVLSNLISLCPSCHTYTEANGVDFVVPEGVIVDSVNILKGS